MTVHFIGAGPGSADLITVRGLKQIQDANVVLYAGSLVPDAIVAAAASDAFIMNTAPLNLDEIIEQIVEADAKGFDVARVHSGDPSIYGAIAEQMRRLDELGIDYDVTPGVSAYAAAAAELKTEISEYKESVSDHFQTTAGLLHDMTEQYRSVYEHMAAGAQQLCDTEQATSQIESLRAGLLPVIEKPPVEDDEAQDHSAEAPESTDHASGGSER